MEEYLVTKKNSSQVGVEEALQPSPPKGIGWKLVSVVILGTQFFFWWKRKKDEMSES